MIFAKRLPKTEVNIFTSVFSGVLSIWEIHSMRLPLWRGQELYSQDYTKCPLYGTSHTAVCGQESPALLRGTKFAEPNCFIHGTWILLTCAMQRSATRKTKLLKIFKKITASCAVWQHSGPLASFLSNIQQGYAQEAQKVRAGVQ